MRETSSRETIGLMKPNRLTVQQIAAVLTIAATSSCSWVFMQKPEDRYARNTQPQCSEGAGWAVVDGVFAALNIVGAASLATNDLYTEEQQTGYLLGGAAWALIHIASGASGLSWASKCTEAKERYNNTDEAGTPATAEDRRRRSLEAWDAREEAKERDSRQRKARTVRDKSTPRGFFCSISPSNGVAGFCVRDKAECQRTRDAALVGVTDLGDCELTERAFCFGDRCAPTAEACDATRERTVGPDGDAPDCADSE